MSREYFFLVSSLPMLSFEEDQTFDAEWFLEQCARSLSPADWQLVQATRLAPPDDWAETEDRIGRTWWRFEIGLRNELVKLRSAALGWSDLDFRREATPLDSARALEYVHIAFDADSPLEAELLLLRLRWLYLDRLAGGHYFDREWVQIYYLRLQLLHHKSMINEGIGAHNFEKIYATIRSETIGSRAR